MLEEKLPRGYNYDIVSYDLIEKLQIIQESKFHTTYLVNICSEEDVLKFLDELQGITNTTFNIGNNVDKRHKRVLFSGVRKCHHNVQKRRDVKDKTEGKHTKFDARIKFKLSPSPNHIHIDNCQK